MYYFQRQKYLDKLVESQENGLVKIVTGGRRCGKSFLLFDIFHRYLTEHDVDENHIVELSLDDRTNRRLRNPDVLLDYIENRTPADGHTYYEGVSKFVKSPKRREILQIITNHAKK